MVENQQKYVVVKDGQRVTAGLTEQEANKQAADLRKRLEESAGKPASVEVKPLLLG